MQEKVLSNRKNGMAMMLLFLFLYAAAVTVFVLLGKSILYSCEPRRQNQAEPEW